MIPLHSLPVKEKSQCRSVREPLIILAPNSHSSNMPTALCFDLFILTVCASTRWSQCEACDWGCSPKHQTLRLSPARFLFTFLTIKGAMLLRHSCEKTCQTMKSRDLPLSPRGTSAPRNTLIAKEARLLLHFLTASFSHQSHIFPRSELEYQTDVKEGSQSRTDPPTYCSLGFEILRVHQTKRPCL